MDSSSDDKRNLTRRELLISAAALGVAACGPGTGSPIPPGNTPDAGDDAGAPDAGTSSCPAEVIGTQQQASSFAEGQPAFVSAANAFVLRDSGGLYCMSGVCTHAGCSVSPSGSEFFCPCHGSVFDSNGNVVNGPARRPLPHYGLCIQGDGTVGIDPTSDVSASDRLPT
jgi:Rieske Fe-S protein